jgi:hypothetical protein
MPAPAAAFPAAELDHVPPLGVALEPPAFRVELPFGSAPPVLTVPPLAVLGNEESPPLDTRLLLVLPPFVVAFPVDFEPDELLPPNALEEVLEVEGLPAVSPGLLFSAQPVIPMSVPAITAQCLVIMNLAFQATRLVIVNASRAFGIRVGICKT